MQICLFVQNIKPQNFSPKKSIFFFFLFFICFFSRIYINFFIVDLQVLHSFAFFCGPTCKLKNIRLYLSNVLGFVFGFRFESGLLSQKQPKNFFVFFSISIFIFFFQLAFNFVVFPFGKSCHSLFYVHCLLSRCLVVLVESVVFQSVG